MTSNHQTTNLVFPNFFSEFCLSLKVEKENKLNCSSWEKLGKTRLVIWCHEQDITNGFVYNTLLINYPDINLANIQLKSTNLALIVSSKHPTTKESTSTLIESIQSMVKNNFFAIPVAKVLFSKTLSKITVFIIVEKILNIRAETVEQGCPEINLV